jgi:hypothetical protein
MRIKRIVALCAVTTILTVMAIAFGFREQTAKTWCQYTNGRWASAAKICYSQDCYVEGDCGGPWVNTAVPCNSVAIGESVARLHFYFGNPDRKADDRIFWSAGKPDRLIIEAVIRDGRLAELKCPCECYTS